MNRKIPTDIRPLDLWLRRIGTRIADIVAGLSGFGLILFFWTALVLLLGGMVLILGGWAVWNPWLVLAGMMLLQLLARLLVLGARHLRWLDP